MADIAHTKTDQKLEEMEKRLSAIYSRAEKEIQKTADEYFSRFAKQDEAKRKLLEQGKITEEEYTKWRKGKVMYGKRFAEMKEQCAQQILNVNKTAVAYINGELPEVYAINYNALESAVDGVGGYSFTLVDADTVRNLAVTDTSLLPYKKIDPAKDIPWNMKKINAETLQGILQGESMDKIAKRIMNVQEMNKTQAIRSARTIVTGAENKGRQDSYARAESDGIILQKEWISTNDSRTRHSHAMLDGAIVDQDKKFDNGLMFPGDPSGRPEEVWNCRCTVAAVVKGFKKAQVQKTVQELQSDQNYEIFMTAFDGTESPVEFWMNMNAEQIDAFKASGKKINELFEDIKKTQPQNAMRKIVDEWKQASPGGKERFALSHDYSSQKIQFQKVKAKSDGWMADANSNGIVSVREDGIDSWEFVVGHEAGHQLTNLFPELQKVVIENPGNLLGRFNTRVMKFDGVFGEYNPDEAWATCVSNYVRNPERFEELYPDTYLAVDEFFKSSPSALDFVKKALEDYRRIFDI